jgi:hypothetical protein
MRRALAIGIVTAGLVGGLGGIAAPAAQANCVRGEVVVHWSGQPDQTVWPESYCFHETGFGDGLSDTSDKNSSGLPTGAPSGVRVSFWLPLP